MGRRENTKTSKKMKENGRTTTDNELDNHVVQARPLVSPAPLLLYFACIKSLKLLTPKPT